MNIIFNLVDYAILLCDNQFHLNNIDIVKQILLNNCFPKNVVECYVRKRLHYLKNRHTNVVTNNQEKNDEFALHLITIFTRFT